MTKEEAQNKVIALAKSRVGTHESGDNWTTFAQEADAKGWTMRAYGFTMQGRAWCDFHVDDCFWESFGFEKGQKMLYQDGETGGAACNRSADFFRQHNAFVSKPQLASQVIYSGEGHTGLVVAVNANGSFDSVDGNYSDAVTLRQGLWPSCASGFGIPDWSVVADDESGDEESETQTEDVSDSDTDIQAGDIVSIKRGAKFWKSNTALPAMWYTCNWIVLQVDASGRAVLDQKENGASGYMSPISVEYLTKVRSGEAVADSANTTSVATSYGVQGTMAEKISAVSSAEASTESGPVILNNTATPVHTWGGKLTNVQDR